VDWGFCWRFVGPIGLLLGFRLECLLGNFRVLFGRFWLGQVEFMNSSNSSQRSRMELKIFKKANCTNEPNIKTTKLQSNFSEFCMEILGETWSD
jgi:hypothetical protein